MLLADLGAEVIKIEEPERGDDARSFPPFVGDQSAYFINVNRGKKSIALNLKHPKGREIFLKLAEISDVVVENFRPGVAERLGNRLRRRQESKSKDRLCLDLGLWPIRAL